MGLMKNLIIILIFSFIFSNKSFANDIKLFYIEEMRIGESALLYFSKEEIENGRQPQQYPGSDRYIISNISQHKNFKKFAQIQINYLKNDDNYKMGGIIGSAPYDDIKECLKDKDITENNMDKALKDPVSMIVEAVKKALERTPPELSAEALGAAPGMPSASNR